MTTYLVWDHEDRKLYEIEHEDVEYADNMANAAYNAAKKLYCDCFENRDCLFKLSISNDGGSCWKLYELELCMSPSFYIVNCKPGEDPRPRAKKL